MPGPILPTPVSFDETIQNLKSLQDSFKPDICTNKEPLIDFAKTGTSPVLDFNMPQSTAFVSYGRINVPIDEKWFKPFALKAPTNNYYNVIQNMTTDQANTLFHSNVVAPSAATGIYLATLPGKPEHYYATTDINRLKNDQPVASQAAAFGGGGGQATAPQFNVGNMNFATAQPVAVSAAPRISQMAELAKQGGLRPVMMTRLNNRAPVTRYVAKPPEPHPRIVVIEEYTTSSFLGNYGAGKVVKTLSLMPGERTTISVRTYKDMVSTRESAQNVLDSLSDSSATELDNLMQKEQGDMTSSSDTSGSSSAAFSTHTDAQNSSKSFNLSLSLGFPGVGVGGGYGQSSTDASSNASGWNNNNSYGHTGARSSNVNTINSALNKHVISSNSNRQINVNTSTSDSTRSGEEDTTVRELVNYNKSRVLNFMWRQLLQEYTVITALTNLKFAYTNGYPETYTVVDLNNLENMIKDLIADGPDPLKPEEYRDALRCALLRNYCVVMDYKDEVQTFLDCVEVGVGGCMTTWFPTMVCPETIERYWRIPFNLEQTYVPPLGNSITVKGIILSVEKQTLQTSSLIADALLGRGEALDCFNQKAQDAESMASLINNMAAIQSVQNSIQQSSVDLDMAAQQLEIGDKTIDKMQVDMDVIKQQIDVITSVNVPSDQAANYKKVFGSCCPTPQYTGGCGCGCDDKC
ncbi:hypothetical protein CJD36_002750 [Flavipsychrobacter stenotrophus]|uniref:Uncharacterized protein n=1 Tax=Flavipsychrobacter stenotrophus TaxID=2077091 RepID=A0A2S7T0F7_9BACT|nr:hypothetical protein [Flavipsychrobacter stenotrophus]PQJ12680.1 hypothetical protein CJD36_002750 [Flavipsychrobacter stenotrophus]